MPFHLDVVFVLDATSPRDRALSAFEGLLDGMRARARFMAGSEDPDVRVRIVAFGDLLSDAARGLTASRFFELPAEDAERYEWLAALEAPDPRAKSRVRHRFGHRDRRSALAGLSVAVNSAWSDEFGTRRSVVLWSDHLPHAPEDEFAAIPDVLDGHVFGTRDALIDGAAAVPLMTTLLFVPDAEVWIELADDLSRSLQISIDLEFGRRGLAEFGDFAVDPV